MPVSIEVSELNGSCVDTSTLSCKKENAMEENQIGQTSDRIVINPTDIVSYRFFKDYIHLYSRTTGTWFFELFGKKVVVIKRSWSSFEFREDVNGDCGKVWLHDCFRDYPDFINTLFPKALFDAEFFFPVEVLEEYAIFNCVKNLNEDVEKNYLNISYFLHDLAANRKTYFKDMHSSLYAYADKYFGYCRTTTKNMVAIYEKFCDHNVTSFPIKLKEEFADYKYSQLVELVSVPVEMFSTFNASMSIKDIRDAKKRFLASMKGTTEKTTPAGYEDDTADVPTSERKRSDKEIASKIKELKNPYYNKDAIEQSARYKAYRKAVEDVLAALGIANVYCDEAEIGKEDET